MDRKKLLARLAAVRADQKKLDDACIDKDGKVRNLTADEQTAYDAHEVEAAIVRAAVARLDVGNDDPTPYPVIEGRSRNPGFVPDPVGDAPAIHAEERVYDYSEALRQLAERGKTGLSGIAAEVDQELRKSRGSDSPPPRGILLPLGTERSIEKLLYGKRGMPQRRDLTTVTGGSTIYITEEQPFIELLRNKMVTQALGATVLTGLSGKVSFIRQTGPTGAYWVGEGVSLSPTNPTFDNVPLVDKTLGALVPISRKFLYQTSIDAKAFVKNDMAKVIALEWDRAAINGSGSAAVPLGLCQSSAVQAFSAGVQGGPNGAKPTYQQLVAMESQVATLNADLGSLKYLVNPAIRGYMKVTQQFPGANTAATLFAGGEINGYPALVSNQVPAGITKGTSTNCAAMIFGNWADLIIGQWGGIDVMENPYTNQANGAVVFSMMMEADVAIRHPESFSVVLDALAA